MKEHEIAADRQSKAGLKRAEGEIDIIHVEMAERFGIVSDGFKHFSLSGAENAIHHLDIFSDARVNAPFEDEIGLVIRNKMRRLSKDIRRPGADPAGVGYPRASANSDQIIFLQP